jgi:pullulanase/glycogen debranching enzyme
VELCLTAEGSDVSAHPQSLRGLDASTYYRGASDAVLNTGHAVVRSLLTAALHAWALEFRVDGFVFAAAENMAMDANGTVQARARARTPSLRRAPRRWSALRSCRAPQRRKCACR